MEPKDIENQQAELISKYLRDGTVLVPKPDWIEYYKRANMLEYMVTEKDERQKATIGDNWVIK